MTDSFDIGVLIGSHSDSIFNEQLALSPAATKAMTAAMSIPCGCADPGCPRKTFQYILKMAAGEDKERATKFIEEAQHCTEGSQIRELMVKYHGEICPHQHEDEGPMLLEPGVYAFGSVEEAEEFLNSILGGGTKH